MAGASVDDFPGGGVGGDEGRVVRLELEDEPIKNVLEVGVGAGDLGSDGFGDAAAPGDGGAWGADGAAVSGGGTLEVGEDGRGEVELGHFHWIGGDEGGGFVVNDLGGIVEQGVAEVFQSTFFGLEFGGESSVSDLEREGTGSTSDDEGAANERGFQAVLIQGDAGDRTALGLGEGGEDVDASGVSGLGADECGQAGSDRRVFMRGEDQMGGLKHVDFVDLVFGHGFGVVVWVAEMGKTEGNLRKMVPRSEKRT